MFYRERQGLQKEHQINAFVASLTSATRVNTQNQCAKAQKRDMQCGLNVAQI